MAPLTAQSPRDISAGESLICIPSGRIDPTCRRRQHVAPRSSSTQNRLSPLSLIRLSLLVLFTLLLLDVPPLPRPPPPSPPAPPPPRTVLDRSGLKNLGSHLGSPLGSPPGRSLGESPWGISWRVPWETEMNKPNKLNSYSWFLGRGGGACSTTNPHSLTSRIDLAWFQGQFLKNQIAKI